MGDRIYTVHNNSRSIGRSIDRMDVGDHLSVQGDILFLVLTSSLRNQEQSLGFAGSDRVSS